MAHLHLPDETNAPLEARGVLQDTRRRWGYIPDLVRALGIRPDLMRAEDAWSRSVMYEGELGDELKRHVALVVSIEEDSDYCMAAMRHQAQISGARPALTEAIVGQDWDAFEEEDAAALRFAHKVASEGRAGPDDVHGLRRYFSDGQIVELVALIGSLRMYATFAEALGLQVEAHLTSGPGQAQPHL